MSRAEAGGGGNLVALAAIQGFRMASGMAVNVMVMRGLGVSGFGVYGYITTLVGLASFGASMGMDRLLKREMAREPESVDQWVSAAIGATAVLSAITAGGIVLWTSLADGRGDVVSAAVLASVAVGLQALAAVPVSYFHAIRRMRLGVPASLAGRVTLVAATAGFLASGMGVVAVFAAQLLDAAATLAGTAWLYFRQRPGRPRMPSWPAVSGLMRDAVPFGLNGLFGAIYLNADVILLANLKDDHEVGVYRAAVMLIALFPVVAETFTTGLFPRMARHLGNVEAASAELRFATRLLLAISVPAAVGGMLTAASLMVFLGGEDYAVSALPFLVMAPLLPLRFLNNGYGMTLSALDRQGDRTRGVFLAAVFNMAANLWAIPAYGALGAAAVTLATEVGLAVWMSWAVRPLVSGLGLGESLLRVGLAAAAMAGAIVLLPPLPVLVTILLGGAVYAAAALATRAIRRSDLRQLRGV